MKVSVIILNWNGKKMLEQYLPSVCEFSQGEGVEVVVADNGSSDDSLEYVRSTFSQVRIIELDQNYGFAEGYNRAISQVDSEYVVLLNSDVEVTKGWLSTLVDYMDHHRDVSACQPKILSYCNKNKFEHAGASGGFVDRYRFPYCRGRIFGEVEEDRGQYNETAEIFWATGAALFIRKGDYEEVGGLDSSFFAHMEEIDMCWRLNSRGKKIMCVPQSIVYHLGGGTLNTDNPKKTYLNFRNNLLMIYKNEPQETFRKVFFVRFFFDYLAALQFLLKGDLENFKAIRKARVDFKRLRTKYLNQREVNQKLLKVKRFPYNFDGSIVFAYYLLGKKRYSDFSKS